MRWAIAGVAAAIAITTTMDATGLSAFSALPLLPLGAALWIVQRHTRSAMGLRWGRWHDYGLALLHPVLVIGVLTILAASFGVARIAEVDWSRVGSRALINTLVGTIAVLLTEEGFFRGWLWAALSTAGLRERATLLWTSVAFAAWHVSAVVLDTGFDPPAAQVPGYLINAFVMGVIWGLLRSISGSVIVASLAHSAWNAVAYSLYGFGTKTGALGVTDTTFFAPETGILGLILNVAFAAMLFVRFRSLAGDPLGEARSLRVA